MQLTQIVTTLNELLAGELLTFDQQKRFLDAAVDDINEALNSTFPVFSDFNNTDFPTNWPNYDFFPDKYVRSCVIKGAAFNYFTADEEGIATATAYGWEFKDSLFRMLRDYADFVPLEYQDTTTIGSITGPESTIKMSWEDIGGDI
jgi:hypothetical protein